MVRLLRLAFFACVVRFVMLVLLGVHVRRRELLPTQGPAVIVANHNSHLDTLALMALYPLRLLDRIRPVAAIDYFLTTRGLRFIAEDIVRTVPVKRHREDPDEDPMVECHKALERGEILILYPEGTRGEPEKLAGFKKGIAHLVKAHPGVPVTPVFMHGLGKVLPKGSLVPVPFTCDVFVGPAYRWEGSIEGFMARTEAAMTALAAEGRFPVWE